MTLRISDDLSLPLEAVTESFGILGQRGAGKSNVGVVMAEEMYAAGLPWVAIDPKGDWFGIRAEGQGPGLPVAILGGLHGDVPLEAGAGAIIADLIVDENLTAVLDVSDFTLADRHRFLTAFAERLYRRHRHEPQRRHVFLEEAHEYIPQQMTRDRAKVKEAMARIPLMGRSFGLGSTTMSQRSARLHKDVLTQIGTLVAMRTTGPQDRRAIGDWVKEHAVADDLLASLPGLEDGEAWVWSPSFLRMVKRLRVRRRRTFDSGATPVDAITRAPATLADIDLDALQARMADTIERSKADDPKELRKRIRELEESNRSMKIANGHWEHVAEKARGEVRVERVEVPVLNGQVATLIEALMGLDRVAEALVTTARGIQTVGSSITAAIERAQQAPATRPDQTPARTPRPVQPVAPASPVGATVGPRAAVAPDVASVVLGRAERLILAALAQYPQGLGRTRLGLLTGYRPRAGHFNNVLGRLRSSGLVAPGADPIVATPAGLATIGDDFERLPEPGWALVEWWLSSGRLGRGEAAILRYLAERWPEETTRDDLGAATGYEPRTGHFNNMLGRLRGLGLMAGYRASDDLMRGA
jgi:hypothetical protein